MAKSQVSFDDLIPNAPLKLAAGMNQFPAKPGWLEQSAKSAGDTSAGMQKEVGTWYDILAKEAGDKTQPFLPRAAAVL